MLENALITLLEHDPDVLKYLNQAVPKNCNGEFKPLTYRRNDGVIEKFNRTIAEGSVEDRIRRLEGVMTKYQIIFWVSQFFLECHFLFRTESLFFFGVTQIE